MVKVSQKQFPYNFTGLMSFIEFLLGPNGCPWDKKQTPMTLSPMLLEESHELTEAIEKNDMQNTMEEIGDVMLHLAFQISLAKMSDSFDEDDMFKSLIEKYIKRHPHVFSDSKISSEDEIKKTWDEIKKTEKGKTQYNSTLGEFPKSLPALSTAQKLQKNAAKTGFDWDNIREVKEKIYEEMEEIKSAKTDDDKLEEIGDLLFSVVNFSRHLSIDAEQALRLSNMKFQKRFTQMEMLAIKKSQEFAKLSVIEKDQLWNEIKSQEKGSLH